MTGIELAVIGGTAGAAGTAITVGDALLVASTIIGTVGAVQQGRAQKAAGENQARTAAYQASLRESQAAAMEQQAGQERAVSQREAQAQRKQGRLAASRTQAISAASGAGALDPTIIDILAGVEGETETRAMNALYGGEERAAGLEYGAVLERAGAAGDVFAGEAARRAGESAAGRSNLTAAGRFAYGAGTIGNDLYDRRKAKGTILEGSGGLSRYSADFFDDAYGYG